MNKLRHLIPALLALTLLASCTRTSSPPDASSSAQPWENAELFLSLATEGVSTQRFTGITQRLLEASGGRIYCNCYSEGSMGGDAELLRAVKNGTISVILSATSVQSKEVPELALLDTPYLFSDEVSCNEQLNHELLDFFQPYYNKAGLQLLAWYCPGFRELTSSVLIERPADLSKLKIRTMDNKYHQIYWAAVGAHPQSVSYSNLFYAAQQGVINAQENILGATLAIDLQYIQPYYILTNHLPFINAVVMNKELYDSLSPEEQKTVSGAFQDQFVDPSGFYEQDDPGAYFSYVLTPSPELQQKLESGVPAVRAALEEDLGKEVTDAFYAAVGADPPQ